MSRTRTLIAGLVGLAALAAPFAVAPAAHAASPVQFRTIYFDPPGPDGRGNTNVNHEWIQVRNVTRSTIAVAGWQIRDTKRHTFVFPRGFTIRGGATVTIHTGKGRNTSGTLYWNQGYYVWNNTGDTATLVTSRGSVADRCSYRKNGHASASC